MSFYHLYCQLSAQLKKILFLLKSNPNDNLGVRYALVALLDGVSCIYELNDMFTKSDGYGDWEAQEKWFLKTAKKYQKEIGWWFKLA